MGSGAALLVAIIRPGIVAPNVQRSVPMINDDDEVLPADRRALMERQLPGKEVLYGTDHTIVVLYCAVYIYGGGDPRPWPQLGDERNNKITEFFARGGYGNDCF
ncbi:hypothetical protein DFH94DRAFT_786061 [Russula ochroleuca]|uniref:Uncharacterized protein n=1 Tax=Russula ochroleuca TaxID=152965 RepID=A0A9P5JU32_9AGAM|nr:hypothetical protein DFH94DRAFT_786061 [Russula ochroleuca]